MVQISTMMVRRCYMPDASCYQSRSSMYILGMIPRNSTELAETVPIGPGL